MNKVLAFLFFLKRSNLDVLVFYCLLVYIFFLPIGDRVIGSADTYNQFLPLRVFYSEVLKSGQFPLWYPYQALGLPFLGIVQSGGLYPLNLVLYKFFDPYWAYNFSIYFHFVLAQFGGFLYSNYIYKKIGLNRVFAVFSGFIFGLSGFIISHTDFVPLQNSIAYIPWALLFLNIIIDNWKEKGLKGNWVWVLGLSICLGYQFLAGYPQAFLYTFIFLLLFVLFSNYRLVWVVFFSLLVSLPLIFVFAYEVLGLSGQSVRNYINFETYNQGSLPLYGLLNMIIPFIFGGSVSNHSYYGPSTGTISFEFLAYISVVALPLTVFAYWKIYTDKDLRKVFGIFGVLGSIVLILALGKYNLVLHYLLFDFPFYSKVRIVARHLMEFNFIQSLFIPLAIYYIIKEKQEFFNFLKICVFVYIGMVFISFWFFVNPEVGKNLSKLNIHSPDLYFPLFFGFLFFVVVSINYIFRIFTYREIVGMIFAIFFLESWFVFYNISPSYTSSWWGKKENVKEYLSYLEKLDNNYRICYLTGFPILFNGVKNISMLNYYEPVIPFDFVKFFNIWMNGSFITPNDYFFVVNNRIFSVFSIKYLFVNNEFKEKYDKYIPIGSLRSIGIKNLNYEKISYRFKDIREFFNDSQNLKIDLINNKVILRSNSKLVFSFKNKIFNRLVIICFKGKVSGMDFFYKYKRLVLGLTDGLAIELKDENNKSIGYYFLNDYYLGNNKWNLILIPFFTDINESGDFMNLKFNIYPINSFARFYEIKDIEIWTFPLNTPNFFDNFEKKSYIFSDSFMDYDLYINNQALPLIFSPTKIKYYEDSEQVKYFLTILDDNSSFAPETVFIPKELEKNFYHTQLSKVYLKIIEKNCNYLKVYYRCRGKGIVVFNDIYYRGWVAKVNNKFVPIMKVNGLVKGITIEKGNGIIEFIYQPFPFSILYLNIFFIYFYLVIFILFLLLHNVGHNKIRINY